MLESLTSVRTYAFALSILFAVVAPNALGQETAHKKRVSRCEQLIAGHSGPAFIGRESGQEFVMRGDQGVLRLASGQSFSNATFLGTQHVRGQRQHLFFDAGQNIVARVLDSELPEEFDPNAVLLVPTYQRCDSNCASHAVTSVVYAARHDLPSLVSGPNAFTFEQNRELLRKNAESQVYDLDTRSQTEQARKFFESQEMQMALLSIDSKEALHVLHGILSKQTPVYLAYNSIQERFWSRPKQMDVNGAEIEASRYIIDFAQRNTSQPGHAICLLGLIQTGPDTEHVLVLDSAFGELQLWPWYKFSNALRANALAIYPSDNQAHATDGLPTDLVQAMRLAFGSDNNKTIIDWLENNPSRIEAFKSTDAFVNDSQVQDWVIVRRDPRLAANGPVIGMVAGKGKYSNSTESYVDIRRYSFGRFADELVTVDRQSMVDAYRITPPALHNLAQVKAGDWVDLDWNATPETGVTTVNGPVLSVDERVLKIYDTKSSKIVRVGNGDLVSRFSYQRLAPEQAEPTIRHAQVSELVEQFKHETYRYRMVGVYYETLALTDNLEKLTSVFPAQDQNSFDPSKIKVGQRVAIKLVAERSISIERGRYKRAAFIGDVVKISPQELVIKFGYEGNFRLTPETVASILRYDTLPDERD